jgi:hypothetical protein
MTYGEQRCNDHLQVYLGRERKNFFDLAQILGPLPKAWPGGAACSVDRSGEEDSQNRPFSDTHGSVFLTEEHVISGSASTAIGRVSKNVPESTSHFSLREMSN